MPGLFLCLSITNWGYHTEEYCNKYTKILKKNIFVIRDEINKIINQNTQL